MVAHGEDLPVQKSALDRFKEGAGKLMDGAEANPIRYGFSAGRYIAGYHRRKMIIETLINKWIDGKAGDKVEDDLTSYDMAYHIAKFTERWKKAKEAERNVGIHKPETNMPSEQLGYDASGRPQLHWLLALAEDVRATVGIAHPHRSREIYEKQSVSLSFPMPRLATCHKNLTFFSHQFNVY